MVAWDTAWAPLIGGSWTGSPAPASPAPGNLPPSLPSGLPYPAPTPDGDQARAQLYAHYVSVDDAVATASKNLDDRGITNVVTDGEANRALEALLHLPPEQQGQAIARLSEHDFKNLLAEVPEKQRARFRTLVENTHDPRRKLLLWQQFHHANNVDELERMGANRGKWFPSGAERKEMQQNARRIETVKTTQHEVESDVKALLAKKRLTERDVTKLMGRKELEHELEMKYALNLTTEGGRRSGGDGTRIVWKKSDLDELQSALEALPVDHIRGNPELREIRREDFDPSGNERSAAQGRGMVYAWDGVFEGGDSADILAHELAHAVSRDRIDVYSKYIKAAGWKQDLSRNDLFKAGLTGEEIRRIHETAGEADEADRFTVKRNGKRYQADMYFGDFLAVDEGAVPYGEDWSYARRHPVEHFAEHYSKAALHPEQVHADFIELPTNARDFRQGEFQAARARLDALVASKAPAAEVAAAKEKVSQEAQALIQAQRIVQQRKRQFDIMRNDIFGTDGAARATLARLQRAGVSGDKLAAFQREAAKVSTPQQIEKLERAALTK